MTAAEARRAPDFASWKAGKQYSLFWNEAGNKWETKAATPADPNDPFWGGYAYSYEFGEKLAKGIAYDLFGLGIIAESWGLYGEEGFHDFAILQGERWQLFANARHKLLITPLKEKQGEILKIVGAKTEAYVRNVDGKSLLTVEVKRN